MYAGTPGTIEWAKKRPVFQRKSFASGRMSEIAKIIDRHDGKRSKIDEEAALFYLSGHIFHLVEAEAAGAGGELAPDRAAFVEEHVQRLNSLGVRMFAYLCVISAEEAGFGEARNPGLWDFIESNTSEDAAKWIKGIFSRERERGFFAKTGKASVGECLKALEMGFRFGRWHPGFGGLPWAEIAGTALEAANGESSLELCVDKAFSLCHNNGAIFNKGHVFGHYSHSFYELLDIQASGQLPGAIAKGLPVDGLKAASVKALFEQGKRMFPEDFARGYDPKKVKSMASVREAKAEALMKKAHAHLAAPAAPVPEGPPARACDNLITLEELEGIHRGLKGRM